jgi:glucokinase
MPATVIAADIGGTNLRAAVVDAAGHILARRQAPTPKAATANEIIGEIVALLRAVVQRSDEPPLGVCLAVPGLINGDAGKVVIAPNVPGFRNLILTTPVSEALGVPAFIENDASAAGLGEFRFGAGRGTRNLIHATLGTGIGGGLVIEGRLYRGSKGLAGEIGHMVMDPAGPVCNCGSRGCLEALVSGVAFAERARRLLARKHPPILAEVVGDRTPTAVDLMAAAQQSCPFSIAEIQNGGHTLGLAFGGLTNVLNPDAITLSGGLLAMGDLLLGPMRKAMYSIAYGPASGTLVRTSTLGDDAGLLGAAAVAFERLG